MLIKKNTAYNPNRIINESTEIKRNLYPIRKWIAYKMTVQAEIFTK